MLNRNFPCHPNTMLLCRATSIQVGANAFLSSLRSDRLTHQGFGLGDTLHKRFLSTNTAAPFATADNYQNNDAKKGPLRVPGHGLPVDFEIFEGTGIDTIIGGFSHGFSQWIQHRRNTIKELTMIRIMDALTDKPHWHQKVFDEQIMTKWKLEGMRSSKLMITEKTWEWMVKELRWKARRYAEQGFTTSLETGTVIVKADGKHVGEDLREELKRAVQPLLQVDEAKKDWHPGSEGMVLNLVHPSLYAFVYGRTPVLVDTNVDLGAHTTSIGQRTTTLSADAADIDDDGLRPNTSGEHIYSNRDRWSTKFQWLSCEVAFTGDDGVDVKITSYINNLHPIQHSALYSVVAKMISKSIQPWNEVLGKYQEHYCGFRTWQDGEISQFPDDIPDYELLLCLMNEDGDDLEENRRFVEDYLTQPDNPMYMPAEHGDHPEYRFGPHGKPFPLEGKWWKKNPDLEMALYDKWERVRITEHPEPDLSKFDAWAASKPYSTAHHKPAELRGGIENAFREDGLQVIVKLSSIELRPEKPDYTGGSWHLEGKMNEHIVATSIYYYDVDNVTESRLTFRQEAQLDMMDIEYDASNHGPIDDVYSVRNLNDCPGVQLVGSVATKQGRLLVFPNTLQHRVEPFSLVDRTRPGHRRFLVVWLVDPHYRVLSTRNVPPQQKEWWVGFNGKDSASSETAGQEDAYDYKSWTMSREEAKRFRLELMAERTNVMKSVEGSYENYNFCEH